MAQHGTAWHSNWACNILEHPKLPNPKIQMKPSHGVQIHITWILGQSLVRSFSAVAVPSKTRINEAATMLRPRVTNAVKQVHKGNGDRSTYHKVTELAITSTTHCTSASCKNATECKTWQMHHECRLVQISADRRPISAWRKIIICLSGLAEAQGMSHIHNMLLIIISSLGFRLQKRVSTFDHSVISNCAEDYSMHS